MQRRRLSRLAIGGALTIGSMLAAGLSAPAVAGSGGAAVRSDSPVTGTLHVLSDIGTRNLDPTAANAPATRSFLSGLVIRSLTQVVFDPTSHTTVLKPDLALGLGSHNATYTSWTFTLRSGITFENGRPVTAEDVKYGIERSFDRVTFPGGPAFSNEFFWHGHSYHGPYHSGTNYGGVVISGQKITMRMSQPFPDLPYYLSYPDMSPIPPGQASNPATYQHHPLATGPYKFAQYSPGHFLQLIRNPYWDAASDPVRTQRLAGISFRFDMSGSVIDQTLLQNRGDAVDSISLGSVLPADYQTFQHLAPQRLLPGVNGCVDLFDPDNRTFRNINVRRAMGWAFPYQQSWAAGGHIQGVTRLPATNFEPPGVPGRISYNPLPGHTPGSTDPTKAKSLLIKAHRLHAVVKFAYETDVPNSVQVKNVLVVALKAAGFSPEPYATTKANYQRDVLDNPKSPVDARMVTRCSPFPTGSSVIGPEFGSTDIGSDGFGDNYAAFSNVTIDARMGQATLLPLDRQPAAWNQLDKAVGAYHFAAFATAYDGVALMRGSAVHGFQIDATRGLPIWNAISLG